MHCLNNIDRLVIDKDMFMTLLKLYEYRGKDYYFESVLKPSINQIIKQTIERDTFYLAQIMETKVSANRQKLIIKKDSEPKNKEEQLLKNIKNVFKIISEQASNFIFSTNEMLQLGLKLYDKVAKIAYETKEIRVQNNLIVEKKRESKRDDMERLLKQYQNLLSTRQYETTLLVTNFYIDFINLAPFTIGNEYIGLITIYILLLREKFKMFRHVSFFEMLYDQYENFKNSVIKASFNWDKGFSQTGDLNNLIVNILLEGYQKVDKIAKASDIDKVVRKSYSLENTIQKLGETFTKEDIRIRHPYVSESTIDRTLKRLKEENKIRPNGTGRSASWINLSKYERFEPVSNRQLSLYDIMIENNDEDA